MFKALKEIFIAPTPEQTYLGERLQSAKWLGWEMRSAPAQAVSLRSVTKPAKRLQPADEAPADSLLANPVINSKPA